MGESIHGASTQIGPALGPKLEVIRGNNADEVFKVKLKTKIGRERDNDVTLLDPKTSRYHAQITLEAGQWVLQDLGSANGTYLNEAVLTAPTPLQTEDRIRVGETELIFKLPAELGPQPASVRSTVPSPPVSTSPITDQPTSRPRTQVKKSGRPGPAWIAGGFILLICLGAVFTIYMLTGRTDGGGASIVDVPSPTTDSLDQGDSEPVPTSQTAALAPELVLVYEDDFSDSFGGWDDTFDIYTRKVYGNNRYQIEVNASNLVAWGLANRDVADFEMEVEARQEGGDEKSSYGLLFRFQDRENFYRFDISGDGFYLLSKFVNGEWFTLVDWTGSEFINRGDAGNILKVSTFGPAIAVYVNFKKSTLLFCSPPVGAII